MKNVRRPFILLSCIAVLCLIFYVATGKPEDDTSNGEVISYTEDGVSNTTAPDSESAAQYPSLTFEGTGVYRAVGYIRQTKTERAKYSFRDDDDEKNSQLVIAAEKMLDKLINEQLGLPKSGKYIKIYYYPGFDPNHTETGNMTDYANITADPENIYMTGAVISYLSDYTLPAWLSAGLEMYLSSDDSSNEQIPFRNGVGAADWLKQLVTGGLPDFGDAWFVPEYVNDNASGEVWQIAHAFVVYLSENGCLKDVVSAYMKSDFDGIGQINTYWSGYLKDGSVNLDVNYQYVYSYEDTQFRLVTKNAQYWYKTGIRNGGKWDYKKISAYFEYMEAAVQYAKDWYDFQDAKQIVAHIEPYHDGYRNVYAYATSGTDIHFSGVYLRPPEGVAHETSHALNFQLGTYQKFTPFEEGLANVIDYQFENEYKGLGYKSLKAFLDNDFRNGGNMYGYNNYSKKLYDTEKTLNMFAFAHGSANWVISTVEGRAAANTFLGGFYDKKASFYYDILNNYTASTSFDYYLIQKQGKDDFMKVFVDLSLFEATYGKDIPGMIEEWRSFLRHPNPDELDYWWFIRD